MRAVTSMLASQCQTTSLLNRSRSRQELQAVARQLLPILAPLDRRPLPTRSQEEEEEASQVELVVAVDQEGPVASQV